VEMTSGCDRLTKPPRKKAKENGVSVQPSDKTFPWADGGVNRFWMFYPNEG